MASIKPKSARQRRQIGPVVSTRQTGQRSVIPIHHGDTEITQRNTEQIDDVLCVSLCELCASVVIAFLFRTQIGQVIIVGCPGLGFLAMQRLELGLQVVHFLFLLFQCLQIALE